jgi:hypothetical protein
MRVLPMREHSAIRYYPVVDPLNKGNVLSQNIIALVKFTSQT